MTDLIKRIDNAIAFFTNEYNDAPLLLPSDIREILTGCKSTIENLSPSREAAGNQDTKPYDNEQVKRAKEIVGQQIANECHCSGCEDNRTIQSAFSILELEVGRLREIIKCELGEQFLALLPKEPTNDEQS